MKATRIIFSLWWFIFTAVLAVPVFAGEQSKELSIGYLKGLEITSAYSSAFLIIIPGSGPTDRDGNTPLGKSRIYERLARSISSAYGISSLRVDKRGMFSSSAPNINPNAVTMRDYADDTRLWIDALRKEKGIKCVWLFGHSEGGLTAMLTAQQPEGICGLILAATPGRKTGEILREQLKNNPSNAPLLSDAFTIIQMLEKGQTVGIEKIPTPLYGLFHPVVQNFLIDQMSYDPVNLIASISLPILIIQGDEDIQVSLERDAKKLYKAAPNGELVVLPGVTHVLKQTASSSLVDNYMTYSDPNAPIAESVVQAVGKFIESHHYE
ncbi:alpha/beta hydrolase [Neisseria sp. Ec49-e6-T10]|uniref:alpha/beta hydrolase n=1 Tax=Neisseria sp. Ec49-e6-T10 TaxID=3140744 RepID=UPI003EBC4E41